MITLGKLAAQVIEDLSGGRPSKDTPYRMPYIIEAIRQALNQELSMSLLQKRGGQSYEDDRSVIHTYIANYPDTTVQTEESTKRSYIDLPDFFVSLKYNRGLHGIASMKDVLKRHIPLHNPSAASNLPSFELEEQNYAYYQEGSKVYWTKNITKEVPKVILQILVAAPQSYKEDDVLPVTPEVLQRVIANVKESVYKRTIQDKVMDDNKDIQVNVDR